MTSNFDHNEDDKLRALFGGVTPPVPDDGFSRQVVRRVQSSLWKRRTVLAVASVVGLLLAAPAVVELLLYVSEQLQQLVAQGLALIKS